MRLRVTRDGRTEEVEVAPDLSTVTVAGRTYPVKVVRSEALRVELEVGGERVLVENWPDHFPEPPAPVDVNGERAPVALERLSSPSPTGTVPAAPVRAAAPAGPPVPVPAEGGTPILPPMPGKVIEVRVADGERVDAGAVVLVLEAMKMRNEVTAPVGGVVRGLRVTVGTNVRAREPMLYIQSI
jgi:glutaconyl-CoA/methylmalonyl-CoA decarboxylase subunit gamma